MKKVMFSLLLITGSYAAMAQSDERLAAGGGYDDNPGITVYGYPAQVVITQHGGNGGATTTINCGPDVTKVCYRIGAKLVATKKFIIEVYVNGDKFPPIELEATKVSNQQINGKIALKIEE